MPPPDLPLYSTTNILWTPDDYILEIPLGIQFADIRLFGAMQEPYRDGSSEHPGLYLGCNVYGADYLRFVLGGRPTKAAVGSGAMSDIAGTWDDWNDGLCIAGGWRGGGDAGGGPGTYLGATVSASGGAGATSVYRGVDSAEEVVWIEGGVGGKGTQYMRAVAAHLEDHDIFPPPAGPYPGDPYPPPYPYDEYPPQYFQGLEQWEFYPNEWFSEYESFEIDDLWLPGSYTWPFVDPPVFPGPNNVPRGGLALLTTTFSYPIWGQEGNDGGTTDGADGVVVNGLPAGGGGAGWAGGGSGSVWYIDSKSYVDIPGNTDAVLSREYIGSYGGYPGGRYSWGEGNIQSPPYDDEMVGHPLNSNPYNLSYGALVPHESPWTDELWRWGFAGAIVELYGTPFPATITSGWVTGSVAGD